MPTIILICKMNEFWILIFVLVFAINSLDKAESVQLEETPHNPLDEIFGEGWWDKDKAEEWHKLTLEQTFHHQIDRQNTQIGQIEPNSTDQNPPLTESDHSDNAKNGEEENEIIKEISSNKKRKIIDKFHAKKEELKLNGKYSIKERTQIENEIAKHLKVTRIKIYKWKKEFGLSQKNSKNERKNLVEKFDQMKAELKRGGFKSFYCRKIDETVAKDLGVTFRTISNWKRELGQSTPQHKHSHSEQKEMMKRYYKIKGQKPKIRDEDIAKMLKIGTSTLYTWKKQFHPNSVDGQAAANVQEIENSNSESI